MSLKYLSGRMSDNFISISIPADWTATSYLFCKGNLYEKIINDKIAQDAMTLPKPESGSALQFLPGGLDWVSVWCVQPRAAWWWGAELGLDFCLCLSHTSSSSFCDTVLPDGREGVIISPSVWLSKILPLCSSSVPDSCLWALPAQNYLAFSWMSIAV